MTERRRQASCSARRTTDRALDVFSVGEALENFVGVFGFGGRLHRRLCLDDAIHSGDGDGDVERMTGTARCVTGDDVRRRRGVDICVNREQ